MILFLLVLVKASACGYAEYECRKVETDSVIVGEFVKRAGEGPFPPDAESLHFEVVAETRDRLHIKIVDNAEPAYEVVDVVEEAAAGSGSGVAFAESGFRVSVTEDCGIVVARRSSGETIFDTRPGSVRHGLAYGKGFVQLSTAVGAKPVIYGLGQRRTRFALPYPFNYTLTNQDRGTPGDGTNHYGTHPLHVERRAGGRMHGVLMLTASPLQVEIADGELTWRMMGGLIDLYIFLGGEEGRMEAVVEEYTELVGRPCLIPAWTLGLHQCYWGYENMSVVEGVVERYREEKIPLDAMWVDIDYMDHYRLFTTDPVRFPKAEFGAMLRRMRRRYGVRSVVIVDPGVKVEEGYEPYRELVESGMYIKDREGRPARGAVWPGSTIFPDFSHPEIGKLWGKWVGRFVREVGVDGIWNDMNEISNFCDGKCGPELSEGWEVVRDEKGEPVVRKVLQKSEGQREEAGGGEEKAGGEEAWEKSSLAEYEWVPSEDLLHQSLELDARTHFGPYLFAKQLYGHQENRVTAEALREAVEVVWVQPEMKEAALKEKVQEKLGEAAAAQTKMVGKVKELFSPKGKVPEKASEEGQAEDTAAEKEEEKVSEKAAAVRPFILSRASFAGSGRTNTIWLGDNNATWEDLKDSISGVLTMNVLGMPFCGCDVGGFSGVTRAELMTRWVQLGSFLYPFFRSHAAVFQESHELYKFGEPWTSINRAYVLHRQRLQSYWYTLLVNAHEYGTPMIRSLAMEFPSDEKSVGVDTEAMLGDALLVIPIVTPAPGGANSTDVFERRDAYFPPSTRWYDWWEQKEVGYSGETRTLEGRLEWMPVYLRGGRIVTVQQTVKETLELMRGAPLTVIAGLDEKGEAAGEFVTDDGLTERTERLRAKFCVKKEEGEKGEREGWSVMEMVVVDRSFETRQTVEEVVVVGVEGEVKEVKVWVKLAEGEEPGLAESVSAAMKRLLKKEEKAGVSSGEREVRSSFVFEEEKGRLSVRVKEQTPMSKVKEMRVMWRCEKRKGREEESGEEKQKEL